MKPEYHFETLQQHAGHELDPTGARVVPIYQNNAFVFKNSQEAQAIFALEKPGYFYTRLGNPTTDVFEKRMAALDGGAAAVATASGQAAVTYAILTLCQSGDNVVSASTLYGGTYNLFTQLLPRWGITVTLVDPDEPQNFADAIQPNTRAVFLETIGNPGTNIIDIQAVADIARANGIPLIADNTFGTPYLLRPIDYGADIVVHSATKFLNGHANAMGGVLVDSGRFDWVKSGKFPSLTEPDESYHGLRYVDAGPGALALKVRAGLLRDTGACISPFNSFLMLMGLETLSLRMERHVQNAQAVASFLATHPNVAWINYPSLPGNKYYALAQKYFPQGAGSIFAVGVKGGETAARQVADKLKLFSLESNVADTKSIVSHPASTTHQQLSDEGLVKAGVSRDMLRLSIGLEHIDDIVADLREALG